MQTFFDDGNQHISANRNPDLRLHRDLAGAQECLDTQVLLDPFEAQLHLPALAIHVDNEFGLQAEVVGQKRDALASFVLDHHPAQSSGVVLAGIKHREYANLVAQDVGGAAIHRIAVTPPEWVLLLALVTKKLWAS